MRSLLDLCSSYSVGDIIRRARQVPRVGLEYSFRPSPSLWKIVYMKNGIVYCQGHSSGTADWEFPESELQYYDIVSNEY